MARIGAEPDGPDLNDEMYSVTYRGLKMVFVGQDSVSAGDNTYAPSIRAQLSDDDHVWKICSWHKDQNAMQVGGKGTRWGGRSTKPRGFFFLMIRRPPRSTPPTRGQHSAHCSLR